MLTVVKVVQLRGRSRELMSPLARTDPLSLLEQDPRAALWLRLCSAFHSLQPDPSCEKETRKGVETPDRTATSELVSIDQLEAQAVNIV